MGIYKRGKIWYAEYWPHGRKGPKVLKAISSQRRFAEAFLHEIKRKKLYGRLKIPVPISLQEVLDQFLDYSQARNRPATVYNQQFHLRTIATIFTPTIKMTDITPGEFEKYRNARVKAGIRPGTLNREFTTFKSIFSRAVEWGYLDDSPLRHMKMLPTEKSKPRFLSREDIARIMEVAKGLERDIFLLLLLTGMRKGEVIALRWEDVDLVENQITITAAIAKSRKSRVIPLRPELIDILKRQAKKKSLVFPAPEGGQYHERSMSRIIYLLYKKAGIKGHDVHSIRHTFGSWAAMSGVDLLTVKELMGHSDIRTTMIYSHLQDDHIRKAVEKIDFAVPGSGQKETPPRRI